MLGHQTSVLKGAPSPSGPVFESVSSELFGRFAAFAVKSLFATSLWLTVLSPLLWMLLRKPSRGIGLAHEVTYANWTREINFCSAWWRGRDTQLKMAFFHKTWTRPAFFCDVTGPRDNRQLQLFIDKDQPIPFPS